MRIKVKVRFNTQKGSIENVGKCQYILYLPFADGPDSPKNVAKILSKNLGIRLEEIHFVEVDGNGYWNFDLERQ
jgi:hypothetical protein